MTGIATCGEPSAIRSMVQPSPVIITGRIDPLGIRLMDYFCCFHSKFYLTRTRCRSQRPQKFSQGHGASSRLLKPPWSLEVARQDVR